MKTFSYGAAIGLLILCCDLYAQGRGGQGRGRQRGMNITRMLERFDANEDGKLTEAEVTIPRMWQRLVAADKDEDGVITKEEMETLSNRGNRGGRSRGGESVWKFLRDKYDNDKDGKITSAEYDRSKETFARLDRDKDGVLTKQDWADAGEDRARGGGRERGRGQKASGPEEGDRAPDFRLTLVGDPKQFVKLSDYAGKKPVALLFGSCT